MARIWRDIKNATIKSFTCDVAVTAGCALVVGSDADHCALPSGANDELFLGWATTDGAIGDDIPVHMDGGVAIGVAAGAITAGKHVELADNLGNVQQTAGSLPSVVDETLAVAANAAVPTKPVAGLLYADSVVGTTLGPMTQMPPGVVPTTGQTALAADKSTIKFANADAVTSAKVGYLTIPAQRRIIGRAATSAAALGDHIAIIPGSGIK